MRRRGRGGYFTAIVQPPNAPMQGDITPKEMVFVIDQTGSQARLAPIEKAKETMRYCIQNLNPGDTFQLLGFNTRTVPVLPAAGSRHAGNRRKGSGFPETVGRQAAEPIYCNRWITR